MKRIVLTAAAVFFGVWALAGCGERPAPMQTRNDLVLRFFNSLKTGNAAAAEVQGKKLLELDPSNDFIVKIIEVQQCNQGVLAAQKELNAHRIPQAIDILDENARKYPDNRTLPQLRMQLRQLRNASKLLEAMEHADSVEAMSSSLTAAETGLSANVTPALQRHFDAYNKRIERQRAVETERAAEEAEKIPEKVL